MSLVWGGVLKPDGWAPEQLSRDQFPAWKERGMNWGPAQVADPHQAFLGALSKSERQEQNFRAPGGTYHLSVFPPLPILWGLEERASETGQKPPEAAFQ